MTLRLRGGRALELVPGRPLLMGILNATPDSFSDPQGPKRLDALVARGLALAAEGAAVVDVGGESGRTDRAAVSEDEESSRAVPVIERLAAEGLTVSVDTWRAAPARAALEAGAAMVNDPSGLSDPGIAAVCAQMGAGLVITHTRAAPKTKAFPTYDDVVADVRELLAERVASARAAGVEEDALLLDPGLDLGKGVEESVALLRRLGELEPLGRPLLLAISRKDFVGAITARRPAERDAGTLAAIQPALGLSVGCMLRVHDVAGAADYLAVRHAIAGHGQPIAALPPELAREALA